MDNAFALALVARNDSGSIYLVGSKKLQTSDSVVAEAAIILWSLQVVELHKFSHIIIESDAKFALMRYLLPNKIFLGLLRPTIMISLIFLINLLVVILGWLQGEQVQ